MHLIWYTFVNLNFLYAGRIWEASFICIRSSYWWWRASSSQKCNVFCYLRLCSQNDWTFIIFLSVINSVKIICFINVIYFELTIFISWLMDYQLNTSCRWEHESHDDDNNNCSKWSGQVEINGPNFSKTESSWLVLSYRLYIDSGNDSKRHGCFLFF